MEMPLGHTATDKDRCQAMNELIIAFQNNQGYPGYPSDFDYILDVTYTIPYRSEVLLWTMEQYDIWPDRKVNDDQTYVSVQWGPLSADVRVVPVAEHANRVEAIFFAVVLAITSKLERENQK